MSPQSSRRQVVTAPSHVSDVEAASRRKPHHRRSQKICSTERLPALFAWALLLSTSFAYWIGVLPELFVLLPSFLPVLGLHCLLFVLLCGNFVLATYMDPVRTARDVLSPRATGVLFAYAQGVYEQSAKNEHEDISFYVRPSKRKAGMDTDDDDDDDYEPQARLVYINEGERRARQ